MPTESQLDFSGGLNSRLPPHKIGPNQCAQLSNVDLSFGDVRGEYQTLTDGQSDYFYEKANKWVSAAGFSEEIAITTFTADTSGSSGNVTATAINASSNHYSAMTIGDFETVTIGSNTTVEIYEVTNGVYGASSFVEYNEDLYVARDEFTVPGEWASGSNQNRITIKSHADQGAVGHAYKLQVGDELVATNLPNNTIVTRIDVSNNYAFINLNVTANSTTSGSSPNRTNEVITVKPIISKFLDGDTEDSYRVSAVKPDPTITFSQAAESYSGTQADRAIGHSKNWFSSTFVVPFQYGLSHFDNTGVESTMSTLTDSTLATTYFDTGKNNVPMYVDFGSTVSDLAYSSSKLSGGRFALYRVGGSSAIIKRVDNLFIDEDLTVAVSGTGSDDLVITIGGAKTNFQYRVAWYCFNTSTATPYSYTKGAYSVASTFTGKTDWLTKATSHSITLTSTHATSGNKDDHYVDLVVYMKMPGEKVEREYVTRALTVDNADVANGATYPYVDFQSSDSLIDIQPIEANNTPPKNSKHFVESGNIFYAAVNTRLFASDYGNPNSFRSGAFVDFEQKITGLSSIGSELVVFTEYGVYRVFGRDPFGLKKVRVPTTEGVPDEGHKSIVKFQGGIMFASHQGICFYNGKTVERLTHSILDSFSYPNSVVKNKNAGGIYDDVYYLLGNTGTGYKIDLKSSPLKVSNTSFNASSLYYRGAENVLYADTGRPGYAVGVRSKFDLTTRKFTGGDINLEKIFFNVRVSGLNVYGTVKVLIDDVETDSFTIGSSVADYDRTLSLSQPRRGNGIQVKFENTYGIINRVNVAYEFTNNTTEKLYESVQLQYTGTPTVIVSLDGVDVIGNPTPISLASPLGVVGEAVLYYPEMTTGLIPHVKEVSDEANGRILSYQYRAQEI